jgi:hypothetical protein
VFGLQPKNKMTRFFQMSLLTYKTTFQVIVATQPTNHNIKNATLQNHNTQTQHHNTQTQHYNTQTLHHNTQSQHQKHYITTHKHYITTHKRNITTHRHNITTHKHNSSYSTTHKHKRNSSYSTTHKHKHNITVHNIDELKYHPENNFPRQNLLNILTKSLITAAPPILLVFRRQGMMHFVL